MSVDLALPPVASSSTPKSPRPAGVRKPRKKVTENWDDDFEFSFPPSRPKSISHPNEALPAARGRVSPAESIGSFSWDDSPPRQTHLRPSHARTTSRPVLGVVALPPRHSPSNSSSLPSPTFSNLPSPPTRVSSFLSKSTSSTSRTAATIKNRLIKRHPSTSFVPPSHRDASSSSLSSVSHANRSSPQLAKMKSSEVMPPPPLPSGLGRSRSQNKGKGVSRAGEVRVSNIPFSPSQEALREAERRPSLWKRLSGRPAERKAGEPSDGGHRRRRSSSVGSRSPTKSVFDQNVVHPPMPPLPANLRSTSATSSNSNLSYNSQISASSSNRSAHPSTLSSILRRSTSSLSRKSGNSGQTPPSSYNPAFGSPDCAYPPHPTFATRSVMPASPPTSHSFSRGFHLPSPAPGSPYNELPPILMPPLPHSSSFPAPHTDRRNLDSDTETEHEDNELTPRRRRKVRPVSAQPPPRKTSDAWTAEGWQGFGESNKPDPPFRTASRSASRSSLHRATASEIPSAPESPRDTSFTSSTASTLRKFGSMSRKHGRKLSGGFKFGSTSSSAFADSRKASIPHLETVAGSPSKPVRLETASQFLRSPSGERLAAHVPSGSISAPSSAFQPTTVRNDAPTQIPGMPASLSEDMGLSAKKDKQKKRQTWRDMYISPAAIEKSNKVKESVEAMKVFSDEIEKIKVLLDRHDNLFDQIGLGSEPDRRKLGELEKEFEETWEMAFVLVKVASPNEAASTGLSSSAHASPALSTHATFMTDADRARARDLPKLVMDHPLVGTAQTPRSASLPDPEIELGLPLSPPEQWRASTGRQDMSKKQLELLRSMLARSPPATRPGMGARSASTLSASSTAGSLQAASRYSPTMPRGRSPSGTLSRSGITFPSPPESNYVVASGSFPSPITAAQLADPRAALENRRSSKTGLAGLKDFLKSLRNPTPPKGSDKAVPAMKKRQNPLSPTASASPLVPHFEAGGYPGSRSTFLPTAPTSPTVPHMQNTQPLRRIASPEKKPKRPNVRNMFRTSSGNWSDLVRGAGSSSPVPPLPGRKSIDEHEPIPGMPGRGVSTTAKRQSGTVVKSRIPTSSTGFNLSRVPSGKRRSPTKSKFRHSISTPRSDSPSTPGTNEPGEVDRTLRRKDDYRVMGLGLPSSPSSPKWPDHAQIPGGQMERGASAQSAVSAVSGVSGYPESDLEQNVVPMALTPGDLVVLLDYLRQCEGRLGEWSERVEAIWGKAPAADAGANAT